MGKMIWTADLSVGVELIDQQHQTLVARLNDVAAAVDNQQGETEIGKTLGFLTDYAEFHFAAEESVMIKAAYPGLAEQKAAHQEFMVTLDNLKQDFEEEGSTRPLAQALNTFLVNWLTDHIRTLDRNLGQFLAGQSQKSRTPG